ncbi:hypothetical protein RR46_08239 [Papilio xuthus]|uniref:Uncharacterized protein n=1 Tax=Papilio xuthus TaxID=66420 RepID=A0A194QAD9_PAPXU|nr:hypothetical protein RR46_08239 [Papilio xuthus]
MGNTKSKKVKITQTGPVGAEDENRERINSIKTEVSDVNAKRNADKDMEQMEEKQHDNASSASTVEVLDDK